MKKDLSYYLNLKYPFVIRQDEDDGKQYFEAEIPDLPGCGTHGETIEEALKNLDEAKKLWIEVSLAKGHSIPEPVFEDEFSGRFLLRIPPKFHMQLTLNAKKENLSLNQYIRKNLEIHITLNSILKRIEELSQEVKQLSEKVIWVPEASVVEWEEQPSQPADKIIVREDTADFGIWSGAGSVPGVRVMSGTVGVYGIGITSDIGLVYQIPTPYKKNKNRDLIETSPHQEE